MKTILTGIAVAGILASAVFSQDLSVEVISMKGNDAGLGSVDLGTGAGFMRNIAGTLNLPITVEIVQ